VSLRKVVVAITVIGTSSLAAGAGLSLPGVAAPIPAPTRTCATLVSTSLIDSRGNEVVAPSAVTPTAAVLGRDLHYSLNGNLLSERVPPAGWRPLTAPNSELTAYGFPKRPVDPTALAMWTKTMQGWKGASETPPCQTGRPRYYLAHIGSFDWDGGMNVSGSLANTFVSADGHWVQPALANACHTDSDYAIWAGLGGYNHNASQLLQAGTATNNGTSTGIYAWYEGISPQITAPAVPLSVKIHINDTVEAYVTYDASAAGGPSADFWIDDITTGQSATSGPSHEIQRMPVSDFYDGSTADYITEKPVGVALSVPAQATSYTYAATNGFALNHYPSWKITNTRDGTNTFVFANEYQDTTFDGTHSWVDTYLHCS
jgi:hypothetical protein